MYPQPRCYGSVIAIKYVDNKTNDEINNVIKNKICKNSNYYALKIRTINLYAI